MGGDTHAGPRGRLPRVGLALILWLVLLALAFALDQRVAERVARWHFAKDSWWVAAVKLPGTYYFTVLLAILLGLFHRRRWRAALLPLASGALGGLVYSVVKWIVGRHRPVYFVKIHSTLDARTHEWFVGGLRGILREPALSFPSGHATLAFATAGAFTLLLPRWMVVWFALATLVAAERVVENAHWLSDVVAAAGVGLACACIAGRLLFPVSEKAGARELARFD